jgi:hypothetical protein
MGPLVLALLAACAPSWALTKTMWRERDQKSEATTVIPCMVREVRGRLDVDPGKRRLAVDFATGVPRDSLTGHLATYTSEAAEGGAGIGTLALMPQQTRKRWPEDFEAPRCEVDGVAFAAQDASFFRDGWLSVVVEMTGTTDLGSVRSVPAERAPGLTRDERAEWLPQALAESLAPFVESLARHPWHELLELAAAPGDVRVDPMAWLDPAGRWLAPDMVERLLDPLAPRAGLPPIEECALLVRAVVAPAERRYYAVPLPLLAEGARLRLWREGDAVRWARSEVWAGRFAVPGAADKLVRLDLPRSPGAFAFTWQSEHGPGALATGLARVLKGLLTPVTAALDVLAATNPLFASLYSLFGVDAPPVEGAPRGDKK